VKITEVTLHGIQEKNLRAAPLKQALLMSSVLHGTIDDLTEKHGHRILINIVPDA
jgi:hypothetical protein